MARERYRGISKHQEQKASELIRDTRTLPQRFFSFLGKARNAAILIIIFSLLPLLIPAVLEISLLMGLLCFAWALVRFACFLLAVYLRLLTFN